MDLTLKRTIVVIVAVLLIGAATWYGVAKRRAADNTQNPVIVTAPNPRIGDAIPPDVQPPPAAETPVAQAPEPAPPQTAQPAPQPYPQPTPQPEPQPTVYNNNELGFSVAMPAQWVAAQASAPVQEIFFFDQAGNTNFGAVEAYDNRSNETLASMQNIITRNPGVSSAERVSYRGHEGIGYFTAGNTNEHFIFLVNGKIYYIHGEEVLSRLQFT